MIIKSINSIGKQHICLPSGKFLEYELVSMDFSNKVELIIHDSNIAKYQEMINKKSIFLSRPVDSINVAGTKVVFW